MAQQRHTFKDGKKGAAIAVRVTPRASHNEIVEVLSDLTVKIRLTAPPVEGKANEALIKFLSEVLDQPASKIEIVGGHTGRDKIVSILDTDTKTVHNKLLAKLA